MSAAIKTEVKKTLDFTNAMLFVFLLILLIKINLKNLLRIKAKNFPAIQAAIMDYF